MLVFGYRTFTLVQLIVTNLTKLNCFTFNLVLALLGNEIALFIGTYISKAPTYAIKLLLLILLMFVRSSSHIIFPAYLDWVPIITNLTFFSIIIRKILIGVPTMHILNRINSTKHRSPKQQDHLRYLFETISYFIYRYLNK